MLCKGLLWQIKCIQQLTATQSIRWIQYVYECLYRCEFACVFGICLNKRHVWSIVCILFVPCLCVAVFIHFRYVRVCVCACACLCVRPRTLHAFVQNRMWIKSGYVCWSWKWFTDTHFLLLKQCQQKHGVRWRCEIVFVWVTLFSPCVHVELNG